MRSQRAGSGLVMHAARATLPKRSSDSDSAYVSAPARDTFIRTCRWFCVCVGAFSGMALTYFMHLHVDPDVGWI